MNLSQLEQTIEHNFKNKDLLQEALTHRSYLNENLDWRLPHNERLEFLGDAVLEMAVTEELFNRFPEYDEGKLTTLRAALVNYQMLAQIGKGLMLDQSLLLSRGEAKDLGRAREVILANAMEALIGAIYLDADYAKIRGFVNKFILTELESVLRTGAYRDAKSILQEHVQSEKKITPVYKIIEKSGPEHHKSFKVGVYFGDEFITSGEGLSKQEAELDAAKKALDKV